jgi:hypothetical protein
MPQGAARTHVERILSQTRHVGAKRPPQRRTLTLDRPGTAAQARRSTIRARPLKRHMCLPIGSAHRPRIKVSALVSTSDIPQARQLLAGEQVKARALKARHVVAGCRQRIPATDAVVEAQQQH